MPARAFEYDGLSLAYAVQGEGAPVVFVHGATGTGTFEWGRLAGRLSVSYRCVLPDLRGHGRSDFRAAGYSAEVIGSDLRRLIGHLDLGQPHIVGFSYGAEVALRLEVEAPGTARSLALVSPGTGRCRDYQAPSIRYLERVWPPPLRQLHEAHHGPDHWRVLLSLLTEDSARRPELPPGVLAGVRCPILLLAGDHDDPARRRQGRQFAHLNPRARYVEIQGAAHAAHRERPAEVGQLIGDFLNQADPGSPADIPDARGGPS